MKTKIIFQSLTSVVSLMILLNCTSCKHDSDSSGITLLDTTLTYKDYIYPQVKYPLISFSVMQPGIIMLPLQGGIYMPNFKTWYLKPSKEPLLSVSTDITEGTLYYCKNLPNLSVILRVGKENNTKTVAIVDTFMRGFYNVISTGQNSYYVMGLNAKGYHIWRREGQQQQTIFESSKPITAFTAINKDACLICCDKKLVLLKKGEKPGIFGSMETAADGIAVDGNGKIYVSSGNFIYQIISKDKFKPMVAGIHGYLQYANGKLYVLSQEKSSVLAFNVAFKSNEQKNELTNQNEQQEQGDGNLEVLRLKEQNEEAQKEIQRLKEKRTESHLSTGNPTTSKSQETKSAPIKQVCPKCNGEGKALVTCTYCNGKGSKDCVVCKGSGKVECPDCKGTGICYFCKGTGVRTSGNGCTFCNGSGTCHHCNGSGEKNCFICKGSGTCECVICKGDGQRIQTCPLCNGNKYINN